MSAFYGTLQGSRGQATRCGTRGSGIKASAQSWQGSIIVYLDGDPDAPDVEIRIATGSASGGGFPLWSGPLSELTKAPAGWRLLLAPPNLDGEGGGDSDREGKGEGR